LVYVLDESGKYKGILKPDISTDLINPTTLPELTINLKEVFPREP
jgi:hypothetical protein